MATLQNYSDIQVKQIRSGRMLSLSGYPHHHPDKVGSLMKYQLKFFLLQLPEG
jgi:hypothetical protein